MRWFKPTCGDTKIKKKFAILPIKIGNETRWLECVTVKYVYDSNCYNIIGWYATEFVDKVGT